MTSLFFIMLVLFVLTVVMLKREQYRIIARLEEYQKIEEIKKSINAINPVYFEYRPEFKKHIFRLSVQFPKNSHNLDSLENENVYQLHTEIENAGREIEQTISAFSSNDNIQYLVIIEGQASKDGASYNNVLSFQRALALKAFWESKNIFLDKIENCELIVAGSGEGGIPREQPDYRNTLNQRFLIHIIPKTGEISPTL